MNKRRSAKADLVRAIIADPKNHSLSEKALARLVERTHPGLYDNLEAARHAVRNVLGKSGSYIAGGKKNEFQVQMQKLRKLRTAMPEGESQRVGAYVLPRKYRNGIVISDIHFPYQDDAALFAAIEYGVREQIDFIYLNGDVMDCAKHSDHEQDPKARSFKYELDLTRQFLAGLREIFPDALIVYKWGNHEYRYMRWLRSNDKARELLEVEECSLAYLLRFKELGIVEVQSRQRAMLGKLPVYHGHEFRRGFAAPVNPARGLFLRTKESGLQGDCHRDSLHTEVTASKKMIQTYSTGCRCDLHPAYDPYNSWRHGFAHIRLEDNGNYQVTLKTIKDGEIF